MFSEIVMAVPAVPGVVTAGRRQWCCVAVVMSVVLCPVLGHLASPGCTNYIHEDLSDLPSVIICDCVDV